MGLLMPTPDPTTYVTRGLELLEQAQFQPASTCFEQALELDPDHRIAIRYYGWTLFSLGRHDAALARFDQALAFDADDAEVLNARGSALAELKRYEEAVVSYTQAISRRADFAAAYSNRGNVHAACGRIDAAIDDYQEALRLDPALSAAHFNLGNAQRERGELETAVHCYERALNLEPDHAEALCNRGLALEALNRLPEARASYDRALAGRPHFAEAHLNRAFCRLLEGDLAGGFADFEWRFATAARVLSCEPPKVPRWQGEDIRGRAILVQAEQGLGDCLQFCRYLPTLARRAAHVVFEVPESLVALMGSLAGQVQVLAHGQQRPAVDCWVPLLSLPLCFETRLESVPAAPRYLSSVAHQARRWEERLGQRHGLRVGLVCSGSAQHSNDRDRSIGLGELLGYLPPDHQYVMVQKELRAADRAALEGSGRVIDVSAELHDFSDTAALCDSLDLLISVDTSVAHLAAALGRPTWLLLAHHPDWRWLLEREDSPWYPTVRLYRQAVRGQWSGPLARLRNDLYQHANPRWGVAPP